MSQKGFFKRFFLVRARACVCVCVCVDVVCYGFFGCVLSFFLVFDCFCFCCPFLFLLFFQRTYDHI